GFFTHILYELDRPGEWYYDNAESILYLYPRTPITSSSNLRLCYGPQFLVLNGTQNVRVERISIQNVGKSGNGFGVLNLTGGADNQFAGITIKHAFGMSASNIWSGRNNGFLSCDFIDNWNGCRLFGGTFSADTVELARNFMQNCHFTQVYSQDHYGNAFEVNGAGNIVRNNLIHHSNGQPIVHDGVGHLFERNEIFNIQIEEGDGGAIYSGGSMWSFGNTFRHNFIHHSPTITGPLNKAGFFSDDGDGGEIYIENITYEINGPGIKMDGGGHLVSRNIVLGPEGIGHVGSPSAAAYQSAMDALVANPYDINERVNPIGGILQEAGIDGWQDGISADNWRERISTYWENLYPLLSAMLDDFFTNKKFGAYQSADINNYFEEDDAIFGQDDIVTRQSNQKISTGIFEDISTLNFNYNGSQPFGMPVIPFDDIGLFSDEYRCAVPNKDEYRRAVKEALENAPENIFAVPGQDLVYYNSGEMVLSQVPCQEILPVKSADSYSFDLGTESSEVFQGFIRLTNSSNTLSYGWLNPDKLQAVEREEGDELARDFIYSDKPNTLEVKVKNGTWAVFLGFVDMDEARDDIQVKAEGEVVLSDIDIEERVPLNESIIVHVNDGKLTLEFSDQGGEDPNWIINRISLFPSEEELPCELDCNGNILDSDGDGVCDTNDVCEGGDDTLDNDEDGVPDACDDCTIGFACDDGNVCTINDTFDENCSCVGTLADTDQDGICDPLDGTDGSCELWAPCTPTDSCTLQNGTSFVYDENCNCTQTNMALGGTASMSSTYNDYVPESLNDGIKDDDNNLAHTAWTNPNEWMEIDLGADFLIGGVRIWNRTDCCSERLTGAYLLVSDQPFSTSMDFQAALANATFSMKLDDQELQETADIKVGQFGRYVRLQNPGDKPGGWVLNIKELEVFADVNSCTNGGACTDYVIYDDDCNCEAFYEVEGAPSQSSQWPFVNDVSNLTDGDTENGFAQTLSGPTEWMQLDLGQNQPIDQLVIWNLIGVDSCCSERLSNAYVLVADTPFPDGTDLPSALANADFSFQLGLTTDIPRISIPVDTIGRYVRIQKSGNNVGTEYLNLHEIDVLASERPFCDDGDPTTNNDIIREDGCTCRGEPITDLNFRMKMMLEGPFNSASGFMRDGLRKQGLLPYEDPYNVGVTATPGLFEEQGQNAIVDWVLVELRDKDSVENIIDTRPMLLQRDGDIVMPNGSIQLIFDGIEQGTFFVSVRHQNHLSLTTEVAISINASTFIDFSSPLTSVAGGSQSGKVLNGKRLMLAGDANGDGSINAIDKNLYWKQENGSLNLYGTTKADFNLDGTVNAVDKNEYWRVNNGAFIQLP
ncbi:MAG: discoidin domain-containing protein, partial [Bacteroidota bacterium]